jgi:hypothetical protein
LRRDLEHDRTAACFSALESPVVEWKLNRIATVRCRSVNPDPDAKRLGSQACSVHEGGGGGGSQNRLTAQVRLQTSLNLSCVNTATGLGRPQVFPRDGLEHRGRAGLWRSSSSFIRSQPPPAEPNAPVSGAHQRNIPPITNATVGVQTDPAIFASASSPEELTSATATFFPWKAENGKQK